MREGIDCTDEVSLRLECFAHALPAISKVALPIRIAFRSCGLPAERFICNSAGSRNIQFFHKRFPKACDRC